MSPSDRPTAGIVSDRQETKCQTRFAAESPHERLFVAMDVPSLAEALPLARKLAGIVGGIKLGKEFFVACGPDGVRKIADLGLAIFLDLKFHDISNTVAGAVRAALNLEPALLTVHASGGRDMLRAAVEAAETASPRPRIVAVTVLTSLSVEDLAAIGMERPARDQVLRLTGLALSSGVDGIVCAPTEIAAVREAFGEEPLLVVPGLRPRDAALHDQKRVMTPSAALTLGADILVVGRPIIADPDPVSAAQRIVDGLNECSCEN